MNKAVFLDRDGTIVVDVNYCRRPEELILFPETGKDIKLLNDAAFKVIVMTNQSGIARGYFNENTLQIIHNKMINDLAQYSAYIDAIYYCPHHPDEGCECRKPNPKLALQAIRDWNIDCNNSFIIGDRLMDVQLAHAIKCKSILIENNRSREELNNSLFKPNCIVRNILEAIEWIIKETGL